MSHVHEDALAGAALEDGDGLRLRDRWHLVRCRGCAGRLAELRHVVTTGRSAQPAALREPRPGLLTDILAELAQDEGPSTQDGRQAWAPSTGVSPSTVSSLPLPLPRRRRTRWLVAAAALAAVGVASTVAYRQTSEEVMATAVLSPLPAKSGQGVAEMIRGRDGQELSVKVSTTPPTDAFEELWLFDADGHGMISVGILPATGRATFPFPAAAALAGYTVVDVSLEPFDGNPAHSHNSILRGTLR